MRYSKYNDSFTLQSPAHHKCKHGILIYSGYYQIIYNIQYSMSKLNYNIQYSISIFAVYIHPAAMMNIYSMKRYWYGTTKNFILISRNLMAVTQRRLHDCLGRTSTHRWTPPQHQRKIPSDGQYSSPNENCLPWCLFAVQLLPLILNDLPLILNDLS